MRHKKIISSAIGNGPLKIRRSTPFFSLILSYDERRLFTGGEKYLTSEAELPGSP